jgi:hypothetical protein
MNPTDTSASQNPASTTDYVPPIGQGDSAQSAGADAPKQKIRRAAGKTLDQAKEKLSTAAGHGKDSAAGKIGGYSDRLRATARATEQEDPNIAHFVNSAADRLQHAADYVREADLGRLRQDAADAAHRHPTLFMSGMFVAGLVIGNLAKASVRTLREDSHDRADGADDHSSDETGFESAGSTGAVSDSFDPQSRGETQFPSP